VLIDPVSVIHSFIAAINAHNPTQLFHLMTEDHLFVDSLGSSIRGRDEMRKAWVAYFYMIPDFTVDVEDVFQRGTDIALFGAAHGTYSVDGTLPPENRWKMPAAWRAVVRDGRVAEWHIYADNEPVRQIMAARDPGH